MANINRQIILTSRGSNAGPLYDIYYSDDCVTYTLAIDGDNVSLPSIGSSAIITLPDTAICIKLVNLSQGCLSNEVIQYLLCECVETVTINVTTAGTITYQNCFGTPQVVSVSTGIQTIGSFGAGCVNLTTLGGSAIYALDAIGICCTPVSTTTTTTTSGPTTTTTTFSPDPCICTQIVITSEGGEVATFNCYGINENYVYANAGTYYVCAAEIGGLLQASIVSGTGTVTPVGNCKTGACPPATTTSTTTTTIAPTTTTTTTVAPTTTTTTTVAPTTTTTSTTSTTSTTTLAPVYYQILDCNDSSVGYSIAYPAGTFSTNEKCLTNTSRTVIIIGSTTTLPGGTLYSLTSLGAFGCTGTTTTSTTSTTTTTQAPTTTTTTSTSTTTTSGPTVSVDIFNSSLDVPITDMTINGVAVTFVAGGDGFPVISGENGNFSSTQLGTQDVVIYYGAAIPGQNIVFTDSASNITCQNVGGSSGTFTITGATITAGTTITVDVTDGVCS